MNDQPENLGPGGKGQLAVLTAEIRGLRQSIELLGAQLNQLGVDAGAEFAQQRGRLDRLEALAVDTLNGTIAVHQLLTMPAEPESQVSDALPDDAVVSETPPDEVVSGATVDPVPATPAPLQAPSAAEIPAGKSKGPA